MHEYVLRPQLDCQLTDSSRVHREHIIVIVRHCPRRVHRAQPIAKRRTDVHTPHNIRVPAAGNKHGGRAAGKFRGSEVALRSHLCYHPLCVASESVAQVTQCLRASHDQLALLSNPARMVVSDAHQRLALCQHSLGGPTRLALIVLTTRTLLPAHERSGEASVLAPSRGALLPRALEQRVPHALEPAALEPELRVRRQALVGRRDRHAGGIELLQVGHVREGYAISPSADHGRLFAHAPQENLLWRLGLQAVHADVGVARELPVEPATKRRVDVELRVERG
mmetsp:Transcript_8162/g.20901  ORF Transcript_8162/g.20901 Transcript_8162/m.20901 type:complete len:281 (-) Transcript_8162:113-955(-)